MEFIAKNYKSRADLESVISAEVGTNIQKNIAEGHTIQGTRKELKLLHLDDTCSIFGVQCVINVAKEKTINKLKKK